MTRKRKPHGRQERLKTMALTIPHGEALDAFLTRFPEEQRAEMRSAIAPHLQFSKPKEKQL